MKIKNVRTAVIAGNFPWVLVRIDTDEDVARAHLRPGSSLFGDEPHA